MNILLKFGIGAGSSTFGLPCFATPHYQMGFFKMRFAENLGQNLIVLVGIVDPLTAFMTLVISVASTPVA